MTDINVLSVIQRYAVIDAYSQERLADNGLSGSTSVLGATLLTMDRNFDHLRSQYVNVAYVNPRDYPA
jgi:hypothetical protein